MNKEITVHSESPFYIFSEQLSGEIDNVAKIYALFKQNIMTRDTENHYKILLEKAFAKMGEESAIVNRIKHEVSELIINRALPFKVNGEFSELKLCDSTSDKIFFSPVINGDEDFLQQELSKNIKICSLESIDDLSPILPYKIKLLPGRVYNIQELISKVSSQSRTLKIIDPYIYNKHAIFNLEKITEIQLFCEIVIKTNTLDSIMSNPKTNSKFNPERFNVLVEKLKKNGSRVKIENFTRTQHQQRYIQFDDVQIELPGGLDFLDPQGRYSATKEIGYLRFEEREF